MKLTQDVLKQWLSYDPETGKFYWLKGRNHMRLAGSYSPSNDRWTIWVCGKSYLDSHLAWLYMTGELPPKNLDVDHRDQNPVNCRWLNLRLGTRAQNMANTGLRSTNTTGIKGVYGSGGTWRVRISRAGKSYGGYFATREAAEKEAKRIYVELYGEFACVS